MPALADHGAQMNGRETFPSNGSARTTVLSMAIETEGGVDSDIFRDVPRKAAARLAKT